LLETEELDALFVLTPRSEHVHARTVAQGEKSRQDQAAKEKAESDAAEAARTAEAAAKGQESERG